MSDGNSRESVLDAILKAQDRAWNALPKLIQRPALPPIAPKTTPSMFIRNESIEASRPATSLASRPPTNSLGFPSLPKLPNLGIPFVKPLTSIFEKPKTPLYPIPRTNISYMLNLNEIDDNEILRPDSAASTVLSSEREVVRNVLRLAETFSEFRELSVELDQVTSEEIEQMRSACKSHDHRNSGLLSLSTVLNSIKSVLENPSETWQNLMDWLVATNIDDDKTSEAPSDVVFLVDYQLFFEVLNNDKQARDVLVNIPEVLESDDRGSVFSHLPDRPTSSQAQRERWRVKLLVDFEIIFSSNPDIDIERFKQATDKKIITVEELKMLLQIYGLAEHVQHIEQRIIDCFLTHDHLFCFSAFVGCLNQINPAVLGTRSFSIPPPIQPLWSKPALRKLDDSGVIADLDASGSHS
ncbi:unnamed protein product [Caenorhabditis sp. 36 PRJEB53466]|nr:unnamed protein product [Caenorhabditis sp. 36 PRJEB53466]